MTNYTFPHYALIQMYVSLYKLSIERYYIEGLYEVTYNCITSGLSRSTTCARTPGHRPPPDQPAGQQIRKPPNLHPEARRSVIVGESPAKVADLRAGKSLVIVGKSKVESRKSMESRQPKSLTRQSRKTHSRQPCLPDTSSASLPGTPDLQAADWA